MPDAARLWAPRAWLPGGWTDRVALEIGADGRWASVAAGVAVPPPGSRVLDGPLLPGVVDAHSHAFQRAFVGRAERRDAGRDDFWSWRDRMYGVALRLTPEQLRAVAAQLYVELLKGGCTQVCEFHYLQHDSDGQPYPDPLAMTWALVEAAADAGIGLTVLPVVYERAGFAHDALRHDQRRFRLGADKAWRAASTLAASGRPLLNAGLALHSLRGAAPASIATLRRLAEGFGGPIHVHVSEQTAEVDECVAVTGARPIEWLAREALLDARWQLVHATHTVPAELEAVARSGAGVVLCPTTEANLGDGLADLRGLLDAGIPLTIGSDSHVTRDWREELRLLEYGQRLQQRARNVAAAPERSWPSTAEHLFARIGAGAARACGEPAWGLVAGARADALLVDVHDDPLRGVPASHALDALVFSSPSAPWRDVMVGGRWVVAAGVHAGAERIGHDFEAALHVLDDRTC